jgi:chromate reductase, NAD(P)H dehydrogenase (quinone)
MLHQPSPRPNMTMRILAVSGSLQSRSANAALLRALVAQIGADAHATFTRALHELPPFNPDLDTEEPPPPAPVRAWRAELVNADAVVIATPEYAFGIAGSLKNALDWVVGSGELVHKPVALIGASTLESGASFALEALERTIRVMSANVVGTLGVPFVRAQLDETGTVADPALRARLARLAESLRHRAVPASA